ncbi:5451_t:CDS:10 [Paraglomus occultum]|uniref:TBC1 domain family member 31 n=1 Tax=Paraglomus occultum TaxID=144539 RepID=A0A9N9B367_9GLOM|nr:5451_t:CDS:10 [Paraglomus occultum]
MSFNNNSVFVGGLKNGNIWDSIENTKHAKGDIDSVSFNAGYDKDAGLEEDADIEALLLSIINAHKSNNDAIESYYRPEPFACYCFAPLCQIENQSHDFYGVNLLREKLKRPIVMAAADQRGSIFVFDFGANKLWRVARSGISPSVMAFTSLSKDELVVAFTDNTVRCYDVETRQLIAETSSHRHPVDCISMHPDEHVVITSSRSEAILWNMSDWSKLKVLNGEAVHGGLRHVAFSSSGTFITTIFYDESVCVWNGQSFEIIWNVNIPKRRPRYIKPLLFNRSYDETCHLALILTNEQILIVGGIMTLYVWNIATQSLLREVDLGRRTYGCIKQVEAICDRAELVILTSDGHLLLVDIFDNAESGMHLINVELPVKSFKISPDGNFLVTNSTKEKEILRIWDFRSLVADSLQNNFEDYTPKSNRKLFIEVQESSPPVLGPSISRNNNSAIITSKSIHSISHSSPQPKSKSKPFHQHINTKLRSHEQSSKFGTRDRRLRAGFPGNSENDDYMEESPMEGVSSPMVLQKERDQCARNEYTTWTIEKNSHKTSPFENDHELKSTPLFGSSGIQNLSFVSTEERKLNIIETLHRDGKYPTEHRLQIWRTLLDVPSNLEAFRNLIDKKRGSIVQLSVQKWPDLRSKNRKLYIRLERCLLFLVNWGFDVAVVIEWLSTIVYPFVELMLGTDEVVCCELILTILLNWYQNCWKKFPNPPARMLDAAEKLLEYWDASLLNHLKEVGVDFKTDFLWPAMLTGFTRILETEGFLQLWDHLLSNDEPSFMCYFAAAYVYNSRDTLINNLESEIRTFISTTYSNDLVKVLEVARKMESETPIPISPRIDVFRFRPLDNRGSYKLRNVKMKKNDNIRDWIWQQEREIAKKRYDDVGLTGELITVNE